MDFLCLQVWATGCSHRIWPGTYLFRRESGDDPTGPSRGPYSAEEQVALLDYCQTDIDALVALLPEMAPKIPIDHALIRGRYMKAVARMESFGIPVDLPLLKRLRADWQNASMDKQSQMRSFESLESLKGWQRNLGRLLIDYGMLIWSPRALRLKV